MERRHMIFPWLIIFTISFSVVHSEEDATNLELIHIHSMEEKPRSQIERIKNMVQRDVARHRMIYEKLGYVISEDVRRSVAETDMGSASVPMYSGVDDLTAQYFVKIAMGTPPQDVTLIADTGSDLTWVKCERVEKRERKLLTFNAAMSSSFKPILCSSDMCMIDLAHMMSLTNCTTPAHPCLYSYGYIDGSYADGIFAMESVSLDLNKEGKRTLELPIGCSLDSDVSGFNKVSGVLGLGFSNYTFATTVSRSFGNRFSYCLMDHLSSKTITNFITFGGHPIKHHENSTQYVPLIPGLETFYAVQVEGISIGGVDLKIPKTVWSKGPGIIIDAGASLSMFHPEAYEILLDGIRPFLARFEKVELGAPPLDYCFNSSRLKEEEVPPLVVRFEGGAELKPPGKSYLIEADVGVRCVGFLKSGGDGASLLGNIMQQEHVWEFDLGKMMVGFALSLCL